MEQIINWADSYYNIVSFKACRKIDRWIFATMFIATISFLFYSMVNAGHDNAMKYQVFSVEICTMLLYFRMDIKVTKEIFSYSLKNDIHDPSIVVVKRRILEKITGENASNFGNLAEKINTVFDINRKNKIKVLFIHELLRIITKYWGAILLAFVGYYVQKNYIRIIDEISTSGNLPFYFFSITFLLFFYSISVYLINVGFQLLNKVPLVGDTNYEKIRILLVDLSETVTF